MTLSSTLFTPYYGAAAALGGGDGPGFPAGPPRGDPAAGAAPAGHGEPPLRARARAADPAQATTAAARPLPGPPPRRCTTAIL
eukprot:9477260-Pyramimonas_sp.AAC.2